MTTFLNENQTVASAVGVTSYFQTRDTTHINFYKLIKNKILSPISPRISHTWYISLLNLLKKDQDIRRPSERIERRYLFRPVRARKPRLACQLSDHLTRRRIFQAAELEVDLPVGQQIELPGCWYFFGSAGAAKPLPGRQPIQHLAEECVFQSAGTGKALLVLQSIQHLAREHIFRTGSPEMA